MKPLLTYVPAWIAGAARSLKAMKSIGSVNDPVQFGGRVKEKWGKLTDDLAVINGRRDQLEGKIQERYGIAQDQVRSDVDTWLRSLPS